MNAPLRSGSENAPLPVSIQEAGDLLDIYLNADVPAFLWGEPGTGKSAIARASAARRGWRFIDFRALLRDPVDLRGLPTVDVAAGLARWLPPADLPNADRDGPEGLLFLDELNAASPMMQAACFGLVLDRAVGEYRLPPGWRIAAAGNRAEDRAAAQRMPTALANRFAHIFVRSRGKDVVDGWLAWAATAGIHPAVRAFIFLRGADFLHAFDARTVDACPAFPTPRAWESVSRVADAPARLRHAAVAGLIGRAGADEFEGFVRLYQTVPGIVVDALRDPDRAEIPADLSVRYAVATALANKADRSNFANVVRYAGRLPGDVAVVPVVDAIRRKPDLRETAAFADWSVRHADVVL
jgi:hypothetical protein